MLTVLKWLKQCYTGLYVMCVAFERWIFWGIFILFKNKLFCIAVCNVCSILTDEFTVLIELKLHFLC